MIARKVLIAACAAALATTPAWASPGRDPADPPGGDGHAQQHARSHGRGRSHSCTPHRVAYVAAGTLRGHALVLDGSGEPGPTVSAAASDGR